MKLTRSEDVYNYRIKVSELTRQSDEISKKHAEIINRLKDAVRLMQGASEDLYHLEKNLSQKEIVVKQMQGACRVSFQHISKAQRGLKKGLKSIDGTLKELLKVLENSLNQMTWETSSGFIAADSIDLYLRRLPSPKQFDDSISEIKYALQIKFPWEDYAQTYLQE